MFGLDDLAKRLNALVNAEQIGDRHPGRCTAWSNTAIDIGFDSIADATLATRLCLEDTAGLPSRSLVET
jgi:hypothetical protein